MNNALNPMAGCDQVAIDDAIAGMVLFDDLLDDGGKILLPAGTILAETTLNSLKRRDIEFLRMVAKRDKDADDRLASEKRVLQLQRLAKLFRKNADGGANPILFKLLNVYREKT